MTCKHESTSMVLVEHRGGSKHVHIVCNRCYRKLRAIKKREVPNVAELPEIHNDILSVHATRVYHEMREARRAVYHEYLDSDEWKEKRDRIMRRSGGVCEYCFVRPSQVVHHETYERIFQEADEDLVAICHACHKAQHFGSDDLSDHPARALLEKVA